MAMLPIDLPETPQAQPAYRLAAACPPCGAPLVLRQNRQTGALFTGCSAYPGCAFTEPHDSRVQTLAGAAPSRPDAGGLGPGRGPAPGGRGAGGESAAAGR